MDLGLRDRTALVVGPDSVVGAACARALAAEGARVVKVLADDVDIVVAHADSRGRLSLSDVRSADDLHRSWDVVVDTVELFRSALPAMSGRGWGRFVWVGSAASRSLDAADDELDAITSLAMRATQKVIAVEAGPTGVTANAVLRGGEASPDDVAAAVVFLCSVGAGYITGVSIGVDGGVGASVF